MIHTKKKLLPILAAALMMSSLTACGGSGGMNANMSENSDKPNDVKEENDISNGNDNNNNNDNNSSDNVDNEGDNADADSSSSYDTDDVTLWVNGTYAVLTYLNGWDYMIYAGMEYNEIYESIYQQSLEEWWGVEDRESADETLDWVLNEGHREDFVSEMEELTEIGLGDIDAEERADYFLEEYTELTIDEVEYLAQMYNYYEEYGPEAIDGWDYSRAVYLPSMYYLAGFYTEDEAKEKSLEIAKIIQDEFTSWDDFMDSYLRGYEYWNETDSEERRAAYEEIKADPNGPFSLDWNLDLAY